MKKHLLSITAIIVIVMSACAQMKKTSAADAKAGSINYVSMERTACFGQCPNYKIEISEDGNVKYTGKMFAKPQGIYQKNIGADKAGKILKRFNTYRVDTCQNEYQMLIADLPGLNYNIKTGDKTKQIQNAHFGPAFLKSLGSEIDEAIKPDDSWQKLADFKQE